MAETQGFKARVEYEVTDVTQLLYTFPFSYLRKKFIKVDVLHADNSITTLTYGVDYVVNDLSLTLTNPVKVGEHLIIYRQTTNDKIITWNDGSILLASDMNTEDVQMLHLQEEQQDYIQSHSINTKSDSDTKEVLWDALNHRVVNVSDPKDPQDAVTKHYMENVQDGFVEANTKILNEAKDTLSATQQTQSKAQTNEALSKAWATSTESPDNADDTQSSTGKTQSSRSWALYSKEKAQSWAESTGSPDGENDSFSTTGKTRSARGWAMQAKEYAGYFDLSFIINAVFPVGAIIEFINDTDPNELYPGTTWVKMDAGRVLVSSGTYTENGTTYTYNLGDKGGEAKHQITIEEMASHGHSVSCSTEGNHNHDLPISNGGNGFAIRLLDDTQSYSLGYKTSTNGAHSHNISIDSTGGNSTHENRPPYVVVNRWKRTA